MPAGSPTHILGISAYYHDSAACLLRDGEIVAAASEERFSRRKGDPSFPTQAVEYCLSHAGITEANLTRVGFYDKPLLKFERILETYLAVAPRGLGQFLHAGPVWIKEKLFTDRDIRERLPGYEGPIRYCEHHESHAASAFFPSPFEEAGILTVDGVGEWASATIGSGNGSDIEIVEEIHWPDSVGLLYSTFTHYLGFRVNSGEYKVMGLAPYGEPTYVGKIRDELVDLREDGSFTLNQRYFGYLTGLAMTNERFDALFGGPRREPETPFVQRHLDLARSIQEVTEEIVLRMARTVHRRTGSANLCLAGGVALNCVANGRILREGPFDRLWVQPAAGDAGGAVGVAQLVWHRELGQPRTAASGKTTSGKATSGGDGMRGAYLGPAFSDEEIRDRLGPLGAVMNRMSRDALTARTADALASGKVVGWFDGRMEFGPRALGARSILGDPRNPGMQRTINLKIKFREGFRPFAPCVLRERVAEYFGLEEDSPYMLLVAPVREERQLPLPGGEDAPRGLERLNHPRSDIPAVTHVDGSARVQTVTRDTNPNFHDLLSAFEDRTGCAVLVNTSFNVRGEPIVCTPEDAYRCFMRTDMDALVVGSFLLEKADQPEWPEWREVAGEEEAGASSLSPSEGRRFAIPVGLAFGVLAGVLLWRGVDQLAWGFLTVGGLLAAAGLVVPARLGPLQRSWMALAQALSRITTPVVLGAIYFLVFTPVSFILRLVGYNPIQRSSAAETYWRSRSAEGGGASDLRRQF